LLAVKIDEEKGIALLEPHGALLEDDFKSATKTIDPYIEKNNGLKGLLIHTREFPGWESFAALISHLNFVREHHRKIARVALVTDSTIGLFAENIASHFVEAKIKLFSYEDIESAKLWIVE